MVRRWLLLLCLNFLALFLLLPAGICHFSQSESYVEEVAVKKGDSLYRICVKHYGAFTPEILLLVRKHNPLLRGVRTIKPGDILKLPSVKDRRDYPVMEESSPEQKQGSPPREKKYDTYPALMDAEISRLEWVTDNTALVSGKLRISIGGGASVKFVVSVPGDTDYEQPIEIRNDNTFESLVCIGRPYRDYGTRFVLRLLQLRDGSVTAETSREVTKREDRPQIVTFAKADKSSSPVGNKGIERWIESQTIDQDRIDNKHFQVKDGLVVMNYRYIEPSPDERYLSRFGRVTLYGSATLAKALLLGGDVARARRILNVWIAQMDRIGGIPRSANTVGDSYVSPDVRSGDMAHFLGALATVKAVSGTGEYDGVISKISEGYFRDLQDGKTGLVRGGYSLAESPLSREDRIRPVSWASAEHNFDIFQSFLMLARLYPGEAGLAFRDFAGRIGAGLDRYMWDPEAGTFNRGYRFEDGFDKARALDCSSWGALYLLKQARLAREDNNYDREDVYVRRAVQAMRFLESNFVAQWCYKTPDGFRDCISGYKPYAGEIDDVRTEEEKKVIDWDAKSTLVWSEGTLGVAMAYSELCKATGNRYYCGRFDGLVQEMIKLQSLSDKGGLLYSSERVEGHFTRGEELSSLAWLGYALSEKENRLDPSLAKHRDWIPW